MLLLLDQHKLAWVVSDIHAHPFEHGRNEVIECGASAASSNESNASRFIVTNMVWSLSVERGKEDKNNQSKV